MSNKENVKTLLFELNKKYDELKKIQLNTFTLNEAITKLIDEIDSLKKKINEVEDE